MVRQNPANSKHRRTSALSPAGTIPVTHCESITLDLTELGEVIEQLRLSVVRIIYFISNTDFMVVTTADIAAVEDFVADRTDTLSLHGGTLDVGEVW